MLALFLRYKRVAIYEIRMEKFFLLLRYSIGASTELPGSISDKEWMLIYQLAAIHSVLGVMLNGIDDSGMKPPFALLMQWIGAAESIKESNKKANAVAVEVSRFFEDKGYPLGTQDDRYRHYFLR